MFTSSSFWQQMKFKWRWGQLTTSPSQLPNFFLVLFFSHLQMLIFNLSSYSPKSLLCLTSCEFLGRMLGFQSHMWQLEKLWNAKNVFNLILSLKREQWLYFIQYRKKKIALFFQFQSQMMRSESFLQKMSYMKMTHPSIW